MTNFFEKTTGLFVANRNADKERMVYNEGKLLSKLRADTKLINDKNSEIIDVAELRVNILRSRMRKFEVLVKIKMETEVDVETDSATEQEYAVINTTVQFEVEAFNKDDAEFAAEEEIERNNETIEVQVVNVTEV